MAQGEQGRTASPRAPERKVSRKRQTRRAQVLEVAARMFHERGYQTTTTQEIGAELGLLKGSIYYYISSKEDLLFELIEQYHDETRGYFERIVDSDQPPVAKIRELIVTSTVHTARHISRSSLFYTEWRSLSEDRQQQILGERHRHEDALVAWIVQAQRDGEIRPDADPKLTALAVFGMVNSVYRWFRPEGPRTAEEVAEEFCALAVNGLLVR